ncbi:MAG: hypothetical protein Ct9H90mP27_4010 [Gammaproteobacteria bacterium]|nr:MAG: hypothetical protein Ct9H90mP27_4010 [Gammaproteobacteria bacterium]
MNYDLVVKNGTIIEVQGEPVKGRFWYFGRQDCIDWPDRLKKSENY